MRLIFLCVTLFIFTLFFVNVNDFFFEVYSLTHMSAILPFPVVAAALWVLLIATGFGALAALKDVRRGLELVIICLPMSAMPFIFLGVPLSALNTIFMCRSLVNLFIFVLFMRWFMAVNIERDLSMRFPMLSVIVFLLMTYAVNIILAEPDLRFKIGQSIVIVTSCLIFFYMIVNIVRDERALKRTLEVMIIACILQVLLSSLSFFYYLIIKHWSIYRVEGMFRDYELFAEYLAIHIPIFIYLLRNPGELLPKKILKVFLILTIFVLLATATRGAVISLGCGLIYYLSRIKEKVRINQILIQITVWVVIVGIVLTVLYKFLPSSAQIIERFSSTDLTNFDTRQSVWLRFWEFFQEKPMTGHGIVYDFGRHLFFPHSTYLFYLLTLGIPGLLGYLFLVLTLLFKGIVHEHRVNAHKESFELAAVLNTTLIVFLIDGIKIEYLRYPNYQLFAWLIFALVAAMLQWRTHRPAPEAGFQGPFKS